MTNLPEVRERIGAADFQTVAKFLPQSELGGAPAVSENEKAVVMRGGRVVDMFSGRSGRMPADAEVVVASLRHYHMVFGFGDCSRSPYNRAPAMIHVPDLPEIEASSGEILRSMTVAIRFSLIRDDRSNVEKLLALNAARRDAVTVRDLANDLDLPAFIRATFASAETSDERSIRFDEPYMDKVRQRILMAANIALGEYGISASAATLDIYVTSSDAPRQLTESQREELAKHNSRMTQLDAQIEAEKRRIELENLANQREMLRTATLKHKEEQAEIQARIESLDPRPPSQAEPTESRPSAPSAEPPSKPRNRMPLIAAGFFGATIVIILVTLLASQSGGSASDSPPRIAAVAPPTSTATPSPAPTATPLPASAPTVAPTNTPTPSPAPAPPAPTSAPPLSPTNTPPPVPTAPPSPVPTPTTLPPPTPTNTPTNTPTVSTTTVPTPTPTASPTTAPINDRDALIALYNATNGANWTHSGNWLSARPVDEWHGVRVDGNGRVVWLLLADNNLSGEIPPELGGLVANLEYLWLDGNNLSGKIPTKLGGLANLKSLSLSDNDLRGGIPTELGRLANLESLWLSHNNLSGKIPTELGGLANLESLSLVGNNLSGEIPPALGDLYNLASLYLSDNLLTDCVPDGLRNVTNNDLSRLNLPFC